VNNLEKRIERLEQEQGGSVCPICGHSKGERIKEVKFIVSKFGEKEELGPERCPGCSRLLRFIIGKTKQS
jgi:hypothetical protein